MPNRSSKRPRDVNALAKLIADVATGRIYRIDDPVTVRVREANPVSGGLLLELLEDPLSDKKLKVSRRARSTSLHPHRHPRAKRRR